MKTTKLTANEIIDIRRARLLGASTAYLAIIYKVTERTIQRIVAGTRRSSVPTDVQLKGFNGNYELTFDGRIWSNKAQKYVSTTKNGTARLSKGNQKVTVRIPDLLNTYF